MMVLDILLDLISLFLMATLTLRAKADKPLHSLDLRDVENQQPSACFNVGTTRLTALCDWMITTPRTLAFITYEAI